MTNAKDYSFFVNVNLGNNLKILVYILLGILFIGCSQSTDVMYPDWVLEMIHTFASQPVGNPPQSIWRYRYKGQTVYFVPAQCCDQFSNLYDAEGNILCHPDGGLSGRGDGRCPDFFKERTEEILIWRDPRGI